jgi:hypothetical protein
MKNYVITEQQVNAVLKYLSSRPYVEVFQLVSLLQNLTMQEREEKTEKKDK